MNWSPILLINTDWREAFLNNREQTLEHIYRKVYPMVLHYVKEHGGESEDAKDIFQEGLILFYEKVVLDQLQLSASVSTYLMGICKNLWRQELDKRGRKMSLGDKQTDKKIDEITDDYLSESPVQLNDFVNSLGERCKDILISFYYFGQNLEQIALRQGYRNIRTATVQKFKCLERLRKAVSHLSFEYFNR